MGVRLPPLAAALVVALLASAQTPAVTTLKIATLAPEGTAWMTEMRTGAAEIAKRTEGRIKLKFYPGGIMGNDKSVLRKIRIGQLHGGALTSGSLADVYPDVQVYSLPFLFRTYAEVDHVRSRMDERIRAGLAQHGFTALGISEAGFAYFMCNKPVRGVDDLKGQKIWVPEGDLIGLTIAEVAGVTPVPLPIADVYTGLQTGLLDTIASSSMATIAFQWHTRITHLTDVPLMYVAGLLVMDNRAFERLSPEDRQVLTEVMGRASKRLDRINRADNEDAKRALVAQGVHLDTPPPEELARWQAIADEATERLLRQGAFSAATHGVLRGLLQDFRKAPDATSKH